VLYFQGILAAGLAVEIEAPGPGRRNLGDLVVPAGADLDRATPGPSR
jgi:hypothetical protein